MNNEKEELEETKTENKKNRRVLVIIILLLLLLLIFWLGYRVGKIGYQETAVSDSNYEIVGAILLTEQDMKEVKNNQLNIFNNEKFNGKKIIAPHSKGTYQFYIKNISKSDVKYDIKFTDEMKHFVNMKYKLKMDNIYIKGNADNYVTLDELNLNDIVVLKDSINIFTLEWYWEDDDELDTYVGGKPEENRYYKLNLEINSEEYKK